MTGLPSARIERMREVRIFMGESFPGGGPRQVTPFRGLGIHLHEKEVSEGLHETIHVGLKGRRLTAH
jgi:hypothetical protein